MTQFRALDGTPKLLLISSGNVVIGAVLAGDFTPDGIASGGTSVFETDVKPDLVAVSGGVYIIHDGIHFSDEITYTDDPTATAGDLPDNVMFGCLYRGRLIVSGDEDDPQNYYASKVADPLNFDYADLSPDGAFAGNDSKLGLVGDVITALISTTDDYLVIGGDHTLWRMSGDIRFGGQVNLISEQTGIISNTSWTTDETGTLYFVGTNGFYRMAPGGGGPENLTPARLDAFFAAINRDTHFCECEWDRERHGCWVFLTEKGYNESSHVFYDAVDGGFWIQEFPIEHGPICAHMYDGPTADDRILFMGGRDSRLWRLKDSARYDGDVAIESKLYLGPITPGGPGERAKMLSADIILGNPPATLSTNLFGVDASVLVGEDVAAALFNPEQTVSLGELNEGSNLSLTVRAGGKSFFVLLSGVAGKQWALEQAAVTLLPAGRQR